MKKRKRLIGSVVLGFSPTGFRHPKPQPRYLLTSLAPVKTGAREKRLPVAGRPPPQGVLGCVPFARASCGVAFSRGESKARRPACAAKGCVAAGRQKARLGCLAGLPPVTPFASRSDNAGVDRTFAALTSKVSHEGPALPLRGLRNLHSVQATRLVPLRVLLRGRLGNLPRARAHPASVFGRGRIRPASPGAKAGRRSLLRRSPRAHPLTSLPPRRAGCGGKSLFGALPRQCLKLGGKPIYERFSE